MALDCAIIGSGPAAVSAALNLKIHNKDFMIFGSRNLSEKIEKAECVSNYPGLPKISGRDLNEAFKAQLADMGIEITELMVNSIMPMGDVYAVMAQSEFYEVRTIILASGTAKTATLPGEGEMVGRGVSYCATCDGTLYRNKKIAVICGNARFEHEVRYLADLASEVVFFPLYKNAGTIGENVRTAGSRAAEILHDKRVTGVKLTDGTVEEVSGVFILRDSIALSTLLPGLETENGHIKVDRAMATNLPGVFAAGDCTGRPYQYTKAVGEGNVAAHSVIDLLG